MNNHKTLFQRFLQLHPGFGVSFFVLLILGVAQAWPFSLTDWGWLLSAGLFLLGGLLAHVLFLFEAPINQQINQVGLLLAHEESPATSTNSEQLATTSPTKTTSTNHSWIRSNTILIILPILAFYLLSSSANPLGFGFLFGLSLVYLKDIWDFSQGKNTRFLEQYFWSPPDPSFVRTLILGYSFYMIVLTLALVWV